MIRRSLRSGIGIAMVLVTGLAAFAFMLETKMIGRDSRYSPPHVDAAKARMLARPLTTETYNEALPVVNYHDVSDRGGQYTTTAATFAMQLAALRDAGYRSVSLEQVDDLVAGRPVDLPPKPILITFDDGARSAWTTADPILERYGFKAAMFVITDRVASKDNSYYLTWGQLRAMKHSGRWEIGAHTADQHHPVPVLGGGEAPALTNRELIDGQVETLDQWQQRIEQDFDRADRALREELGVTPIAFAYPFAADDTPTNDPRIPPALRAIVLEHYRVAFGDGTSGHAVVTPQSNAWVLPRIRMGGSVTTEAMLHRLAADVPVAFDRLQTHGWTGAGGQCVAEGDGLDVVAGGYATCRPVGNTDVWHDYRLSTEIRGVTPAATATITVRDSERGRVAVLIGTAVARVRQQVGSGEWQEIAVGLLPAHLGPRSVAIDVQGDAAVVNVDGQRIGATLDPELAAGGVSLGASLRGPATVTYGHLAVTGPEPVTTDGA